MRTWIDRPCLTSLGLAKQIPWRQVPVKATFSNNKETVQINSRVDLKTHLTMSPNSKLKFRKLAHLKLNIKNVMNAVTKVILIKILV